MTTQRGSDEGTQANRQHYKPEPAKGVPAHPSDIAQEYTVKLGEDVLPLPERPAPAARRPSGITDAPTSLLSMPSQPESPPTKSASPSDAARPHPAARFSSCAKGHIKRATQQMGSAA